MRQGTNNSIRDFIQGGQLFLHNLRMMKQVIVRVVLVCILSLIVGGYTLKPHPTNGI